jgi:hypothetical protein
MGVGALAECLARMEESNKAMAEDGDGLMITVETKNGYKTVENPYIKTHLKFFDRFRVTINAIRVVTVKSGTTKCVNH